MSARATNWTFLAALAALALVLQACAAPPKMRLLRPAEGPVEKRVEQPAAAAPASEQLIGRLAAVRVREGDSLPDIARHFGLGHDAVKEANPGADVWAPPAGSRVLLPRMFILPDAPRQGIVINLAAMRLFHFTGRNRPVVTYPVGIGEEGRSTPMGGMWIERKAVRPTWYVPASIRRDHAQRGDPLPSEVPPGPDNPLGEYALYLSRPSYVIHGTNKPFSIGMRATNGCIRLYPEDVEKLYRAVPVKTPVHIVNQPYLVGRAGGMLYLEAHAPQEELDAADVKKKLYARLRDMERRETRRLDWKRVEETVTQARGIP
ncbi:MAG TPA: L,D-transpeptidase family protein, partial [Syntrophales bacterium]|nr:L,D-transpeptidase family protein [Syntrophales bacterium]